MDGDGNKHLVVGRCPGVCCEAEFANRVRSKYVSISALDRNCDGNDFMSILHLQHLRHRRVQQRLPKTFLTSRDTVVGEGM